jgi:multiphosphoryl transfer protein
MKLLGAAASPGVVVAPAWRPPKRSSAPPAPAVELVRLQEAVRRVQRSLQTAAKTARAAGSPGPGVALLEVHAALCTDPAILGPARSAIARGEAASDALEEALTGLPSRALPGRGDPREEAAAVVGRLREALPPAPRGQLAPAGLPEAPVVLISDDARPELLLDLHQAGRLAGVAVAAGTARSHGALLARSLGVPAVVGLGAPLAHIQSGVRVRLDGDRGVLTPGVAPVQGTPWSLPPAEPRLPGFPVRVNLSLPEEALRAVAVDGEEVGLLRTDPLWTAAAPPTEDALAPRLTAAVIALAGRPLTLRLYDRPLPMLVRGPTLLDAAPRATTALVRAACRAALSGPVRVLVPFVATPAELLAVRALIGMAWSDVGGEGPPPALGAMIETPAAAWAPSPLLAASDFAAIGTNDLVHLLAGSSRDDPTALGRLKAAEPVLDDILGRIAGAAHRHGRSVYVCGADASTTSTARRLRDLGFHGVSVAPPAVSSVRKGLAGPPLDTPPNES